MFRGIMGVAGQQVIDAMPTYADFLRKFAPVYLQQVAPIMSQFLADSHRMVEANLGHIEDRNTRAVVAAMLLSGGAQFGPVASH